LWGESKIGVKQRQRERGWGRGGERGIEAECCCKRVMVWAINLTVGENIYDTCGRIIPDNQDAY
jgi:hypothetical protein